MTDIKLFTYESNEVRTLIIENEPWFVGKDVATILGYKNTKDALIKHVDDEDRRIIQRSHFTTLEIPNRGLTLINESGVYSLIFSSNLATAKAFKRWVTSEVLPTLRKTGTYTMPSHLYEDRIERAYRWIEEEKERRRLALENEIKAQQIEELQPKACYYDLVLSSKNAVSIGIIAKDYGKSAQWLNTYLHKKGVQYNSGGVWLLYQKYASAGYTKTETRPIEHPSHEPFTRVFTKWTQKGRLFIYDLLKQDNILPLIEQ